MTSSWDKSPSPSLSCACAPPWPRDKELLSGSSAEQNRQKQNKLDLITDVGLEVISSKAYPVTDQVTGNFDLAVLIARHARIRYHGYLCGTCSVTPSGTVPLLPVFYSLPSPFCCLKKLKMKIDRKSLCMLLCLYLHPAAQLSLRRPHCGLPIWLSPLACMLNTFSWVYAIFFHEKKDKTWK